MKKPGVRASGNNCDLARSLTKDQKTGNRHSDLFSQSSLLNLVTAAGSGMEMRRQMKIISRLMNIVRIEIFSCAAYVVLSSSHDSNL